MEDAPLLRMQGIGKSFSGQTVLDAVDFTLRAGEVHVLAGENGAGKSTLIKILAGVHREYRGAIELDGAPVRFRSPHDAARRGIAVIYQELSLIPSLSVADNVFLGREKCRRAGWMNFAGQERACRALLDELQLDMDPRRAVGEYPISAQQALEIAKALVFDARILVMDEPTSALNEPEVRRLFKIIADMKAANRGIIYITHKMEEIYQIADRITVLRDGKLVGTAPAGELPRNELVRWMVGREIDEQIPIVAAEAGGRGTEETALEVENFTVPDPGNAARRIVDGVSFSARCGEILGIGGLQGSGASELLNGLFGTFGAVAHGRVSLFGKPFSPRAPARSIRKGLVLLTNDRKTTGLVPEMSVAGNITLASLARISPGGWMRNSRERQCAESARDAFSLRCASLAQPIRTLSGGNQQKAILARWLAAEPRVLLLDEPTRGVDVGAKREIYELMTQWKRRGLAIVLITSEMPELLALSDRILVLHRGRASAHFARGEATPERILHAAMGHKGAANVE